MVNQLAVVGVGARTPVGLDAPSTAAAVRARISVMREHPFMLDDHAAPMVICADATLPINCTGSDRLLALAVPAAREALRPLLKNGIASARIGLLLALPEDRLGRGAQSKTVVSRLVSKLAQDIRVDPIDCLYIGNAGGIACMEQAAICIGSGMCDFCLVGGIDSYLDPETLEWLDFQEQLHSDSTTWGFCPSEGAGFCVLTSQERAASLRISAPVGIAAVGIANEPNRIKSDTVCVGQGLSEAFKKALIALPNENQVNNTICDMNGEPYRGNEYGFAVLRASDKFADDSDIETPADCWGDVGAASGPLFAMLAIFASHKGYNRGPFTLLWASSECGLRASALLCVSAARIPA